MSEKELYQQKMKAQLDEWKADVDKLKAKASGASADAKLGLERQISGLEENIDKGKARLAELANSAEDTWESVKDRVESAWEALKSSLGTDSVKPKKSNPKSKLRPSISGFEKA